MRVRQLILLTILMLVPFVMEAQCSMCKLMAESAYQSGSQVGTGLNDGIEYIMGVPYILIAIVGYILFKKNFSK